MYYLTYRPRTISELDNTQVQNKIENILKSKNIPHALLFVGPKGMGKTSTARIMAKSLNCLNNAFNDKPADSGKKTSSIEPCNKCANCLHIDSGASPDVVEQDAASNRGIDEVRRLIRESAFAPMSGRYRIYIIDEAHMITPEAFNALLKTLEEPPQTVVFILATTNEEKVPTTIISRCVRIPFGTAKKQDITHMLGRIAATEKIALSEELTNLIANYSDRSFRDAAKLFEELVLQNKLTVKEAKMYLGIRSGESLLVVIKNEPLSKALAWIEDFSAQGGNIKRSIEDMLQALKQQLLLKSNIVTAETDLGYSIIETTQLMKLLHEAYNTMKFSPIESLPLEITVVEFYNLRKK